jgi:hypothetical protein
MIKKVIQQGRELLAASRRVQPLFDARSVLPVREHDKIARTPLVTFFNIPIRTLRPKTRGSFIRSRKKYLSSYFRFLLVSGRARQRD